MNHKIIRVLVRLLCVIMSPCHLALAESQGDRVADPYKARTVRITGSEEGFGFIVGEDNGFLIIATARHVVDQKPGQTTPVNVYFYRNFSAAAAEGVFRDPLLDMALLRVRRPGNIILKPQPFCTRYSRSDPVWWVGQDRDWEIPLDQVAGRLTVSEPDTGDRIEFNAIGIEPGVSGAPLIGVDGIIGMVIEDAPPKAYALDIEKIRRFAKSEAAWGLPDCGDSKITVSGADDTVRSEITDCWDGWTHKKICHDTLEDGSEGPEMVLLSGGTFRMGSDGAEADSDEKPPRDVRVGPFAIARHEVTVAEFRRFAELKGYRSDAEKDGGCYNWDGTEWRYQSGLNWKNPGFDQDRDHPVTCVSWNDAQAYVAWLSDQTHQRYRLPTEAEWEYAARGGSREERFWGKNPNEACNYANVADETAKRKFSSWTIHDCEDGFVYTAPVGRKRSNGFGLFDVLGNVWEWTCSLYENPYGVEMNQCGTGDGRRALRGGSWDNDPRWVRSAYRYRTTPDYRFNFLGFRVARIR